MPAPAILGIGWLATVLGGLVFAVVNFFARFVTQKVAVALAAIAAVGLLTAAFVATIDGLMGGLITAFPLSANVGLVLPQNFESSLGIYFAGRVAYWVFSVNWYIISVKWSI